MELPPNSQAVAALEALNVLQALGPLPPEGVDRHHRMIEAVRVALADRDAFITDPAFSKVPVARLASRAWAAERAGTIDPARATVRAAGVAGGDTVFLCAADGDGTMVSLIQSNWSDFGSGIHVPGWGINLQNRGSLFSLDPSHPNAVAPGKRTMHTLMPAMASRGGGPWLAFGSMGGHGQPQIHLQLLVRMVDDGWDPQRAIDAPRWVVAPESGAVEAEAGLGASILDGLRGRGHPLAVVPDLDSGMGWAQAIRAEGAGYAAGTDPRSEGAALGM
jgi:gamma-glutamyltranspeptidase/glutathione hydrolase